MGKKPSEISKKKFSDRNKKIESSLQSGETFVVPDLIIKEDGSLKWNLKKEKNQAE